MTEIGNILKEARENQNLSFDDVFDILRIQPKFLKAIEEDRWEAMPSPAHVRGYVRKYAQHLQLDPNPLLSSLASSSELYAMTQQMQVIREPVPGQDLGLGPDLGLDSDQDQELDSDQDQELDSD